MHDSTFENEINTFSSKEIYLMGGFMPSYFFVKLRFFIITITRSRITRITFS